MKRTRILNILYDLSSTIGGEVSLRPLMVKTLQRLMYHTNFSCGLILMNTESDDPETLKLEMAIGDKFSIEKIGSEFQIPLRKIGGEYVCVSHNIDLIRLVPCQHKAYRSIMQFPVPKIGWILLLSPKKVCFDLPLDAMFLPFLANLSKAIHLCRINDEQVHSLGDLVATRTGELQLSNKKLQLEVTERKLTEKALRISERELRSIFDNLQDAFIRCDIHGLILKASPSASLLMKCEQEQLIGRKVSEFCVDRRITWKFLIALRKNGGGIEKYRCMVCRFDGKKIWISISAHFIYAESGEIIGIDGTARDITQSVLSHKMLTETSAMKSQLLAEKQRLSRELLLTQEKERSFLAKELHDEMGQSLTFMNTLATIIASVSKDDQAVDSARKISMHIDNMFGSVRKISKTLRPHLLDSMGLLVSIEDLLKTNSQQPDLKYSLKTSGELNDFPDIINIVVYRSIQEALTNVLRHSTADRFDIALHQVPEKNEFKSNSANLNLNIKDNGQGADLDHSCVLGLGLIGIRERVSAVGGQCNIFTSPGKGMHISIVIPLENDVRGVSDGS